MKATRATWLVAHKLRFFKHEKGWKSGLLRLRYQRRILFYFTTLPFILSWIKMWEWSACSRSRAKRWGQEVEPLPSSLWENWVWMEWTSFQGIYVNLLCKRWEKFSPNCYCVIQLFISLWTLWILSYTVERTESNALWKSFRLVNIVSDNFLSLINVDIW